MSSGTVSRGGGNILRDPMVLVVMAPIVVYGRLDIFGDGLHSKSAEWPFGVITER